MEKSVSKPDYSYFLTLTYNEDNIPVYNGRLCFSKAHITTFLDSLRHFLRDEGYSLRYFGTCEYGENGYRPHYHFIIFLYRQREDSTPFPRWAVVNGHRVGYFGERIVSPLWRKGFVYEGTCTAASVLYCTSYALKDDEFLEKDWEGFEPGKPFRRYSLKPGLGLTDSCLSWWLDYIQNDGKRIRNSIKISLPKRSLSTGIPVGIKRRLASCYPDIYDQLVAANMDQFMSTQEDLRNNALKYGSKRSYIKEGTWIQDMFNDSIDKELIAFRKAIRKLNKSTNKL